MSPVNHRQVGEVCLQELVVTRSQLNALARNAQTISAELIITL